MASYNQTTTSILFFRPHIPLDMLSFLSLPSSPPNIFSVLINFSQVYKTFADNYFYLDLHPILLIYTFTIFCVLFMFFSNCPLVYPDTLSSLAAILVPPLCSILCFKYSHLSTHYLHHMTHINSIFKQENNAPTLQLPVPMK